MAASPAAVAIGASQRNQAMLSVTAVIAAVAVVAVAVAPGAHPNPIATH